MRGDVGPEERDLAKRMSEDFGRFEPAAVPEDQQLASQGAGGPAEEEDFMMYQVKADRTVVNHEEKPQAEVWKDKGNAAYVHLHTNVDLPTPSLSLRLFHLFHSVREVKNQREFDRSDQMMVKQVREKELTDRPFFFFVMWSFQRQV